MKKKHLIITIVALVILVPIVVTSITRRGDMENMEEEGQPILLEVEGRITEEDGHLILTSDYDKRYILTGPREEELRLEKTNRVEVVGRVRRPPEDQFERGPIRFMIEVNDFDVKVFE